MEGRGHPRDLVLPPFVAGLLQPDFYISKADKADWRCISVSSELASWQDAHSALSLRGGAAARSARGFEALEESEDCGGTRVTGAGAGARRAATGTGGATGNGRGGRARRRLTGDLYNSPRLALQPQAH